jgi:putative transposase
LLEVLDALKVADVGDRARQDAEMIYQALIEAELTEAIGAVPHERSAERAAQRNGHRATQSAIQRGNFTSARDGSE